MGFVDRSVKALEINDVAPSVETVREKTYPISRDLYMITNGEPAEGSHIAAFLNLSYAEKGREIVEEIGFVPAEKK